MRPTASRLHCGASFYPEADLEGFDVRMRFGQRPRESAVLHFQLAQARVLVRLHAAVLVPSLVETGRTEAVVVT